jgi:hypothetical protein
VQAKGMSNIFNQKNNRKLPKSRENYSHTNARGLQNTKQTRPKYIYPHNILPLKQVQRPKKKY